MNESGLLDLGLQTHWEAETGGTYLELLWGSVKSHLSTVRDLVVPLYGIKRKRLPPRWGSGITRSKNKTEELSLNMETNFAIEII